MPQSSLFRWRDGQGWLVLSGGGDFQKDETVDIDAAVLGRTFSLSPLAYIWAAGDVERADRYLEYVQNLGGRTGYLVDIISEDDPTIEKQLREAGIIVLGEGTNLTRLNSGLTPTVMNALQYAFENGATIYGQGRGSQFLASRINLRDNEWQSAGGWIHNALVMPYYTGAEAVRMQTWLKVHPEFFGIGLGKGAALAFAPDGQIEIWGQQAVTVALGQNFKKMTDTTTIQPPDNENPEQGKTEK